MFRLPTHLESFIPPPNAQVPQGRPWRGSLILPPTGLLAAASSPLELRCTAAETDGDNPSSKTELWPPLFHLQIMNQRPLLREIHDWVKAHPMPMCMFMPDRLPDANAHRANQMAFDELAGLLMQNQWVAIAQWGVPDRITGAGIILFPTGTSRNLLVGALFLHSNFPEFINNALLFPRSLPYSPTSGHTPYDPAPPHIAASQRHYQGSGSQSRYPA